MRICRELDARSSYLDYPRKKNLMLVCILTMRTGFFNCDVKLFMSITVVPVSGHASVYRMFNLLSPLTMPLDEVDSLNWHLMTSINGTSMRNGAQHGWYTPWKTVKNDNGNIREAFIIMTKLFRVIAIVCARIRVYHLSIVGTSYSSRIWIRCSNDDAISSVLLSCSSFLRKITATLALNCEWQLNRKEALSCPWSTLFSLAHQGCPQLGSLS